MGKIIRNIALGFAWLGMSLGACVGGVMVYAALDHNPQREYTNNPELLIPIFYCWCAAVSSIFFIPIIIVEAKKNGADLIRMIRSKKINFSKAALLASGILAAVMASISYLIYYPNDHALEKLVMNFCFVFYPFALVAFFKK